MGAAFLEMCRQATPCPYSQQAVMEIKAGPGGQQFCPGRSLHEDAARLEVEPQFNRKGSRCHVVRPTES
jgi:hypothetical protein